MSSPFRRAAERLLAIAVALAALSGAPANAQTDPFALPKTVTAKDALAATEGPGLSEIEVDGEVRPRMVNLRGYGDSLTIDAADARGAGLPVPDEVSGPIKLSSLRLFAWKFHAITQRLSVTLFRNKDGDNLRDLASTNRAAATIRNITSLRIGYDVAATVQRSVITPAFAFDATLSRGESRATTQYQIAGGRGIRLETYAIGRVPGTHVFAKLGDFISSGSQAQRPIRMAGLQFASSFVDRPDLITTPLPAFSGAVAVPTEVDIITRDQKVDVGTVQPGDYLIRNIPVNSGRGSVDVVLTDALGRQTVRTVNFYQSSTLLAPGLNAYAFNAGFVRRNFGIASNDYGTFVATGFWRRGLSPFATLETSAEFSPGIVNLGSRADGTIGNLALASVELRASNDARSGSGYLANLSLESMTSSGGVRVGVALPSRNYRDVASHLGDRSPNRQIFAGITYRLANKIPISVSYARQNSVVALPGRPETRKSYEILSANSSFMPHKDVRISVQGGMKGGETRSFFASLGVSVSLGAKHTVTGSARREDGFSENSVGYIFDNRDLYGAHIEASVTNRQSGTSLSATGTFTGRHADLQLGGMAYNGSIVGQATLRGSLIAVGNTTYARSSSGMGYALIRTGDVGAVPVKVESRLVGKTDKGGRLLVDNLSTRVPLRVTIDDVNLPLDALVLTTQRMTQVFPNAVGVVDFEARRFVPVVRTVVDAIGRSLTAGMRVVAYPSKVNSLTGYDGTIEINAAGGDRYLEIGRPGRMCRVDLPNATELERGTAPLTCRPITIAGNEDKGLAGAKVAQRD